MKTMFRPALSLFVFLTLLTGLAYPLLVTGMARWFFPEQAAGSLIKHNGQWIGSHLIGQSFSDPKYFWGRPSATAPMPYNAAGSGGSNLGPLNPALVEAVKVRVAALRDADPANRAPVPADLVTASGSGLDPHISPAAAAYQIDRVSRRRGLAPEQLRALVDQYTEGRQWGIFGEARVNVLELNLALDQYRE